MGGAPTSANFGFLQKHDPLLVSLGALAERYFADDPTTTVIKLRQFAETLARHTAANLGLPEVAREQQIDLLQRLRTARALTPEVHELFGAIRRAGNNAVHENVAAHREALHCLKLARELAIWFHRSFGGGQTFNPGPFLPPSDPGSATKELQAELERLRKRLDEVQLSADANKAVAAEEARRRLDAEARAKKDAEEREIWEQLAAEADSKLSATLASLSKQAEAKKPAQMELLTAQLVEAGNAVDLDEADTRILIDEQLRQAGWQVDSQALKYQLGSRPIAGKNLAIAEWPTNHGPADYVLFVGVTAVGVVEAKRQSKDVSGSLQQARRYSENFVLRGDEVFAEGAPWGKYKVPFLYATNGRPWFKQLSEKSGIWFQDVRRNTNLPRPLMGWPTPEGLRDLLKHDVDAAAKKLKAESPKDLPGLRAYQVKAIRAVEDALEAGKRQMLVEMATGTGKTRTFIGLIYRLVKTSRFRRILFLVDRNALGEQASTAFKTEFVEGTQKFSDVFNIKDLDDVKPDSETRLHFATVQAVAKRLFHGDDSGAPQLHIDDYDCIVVDECHRGYTLDKELSETELGFRNQDDYLSVYRRVLDFFDAVKIGLTATPALHTTEIFDAPVYEYCYREAVVEGYLVDHEPPYRIETRLSAEGIHFKLGEQAPIWNVQEGAPDFVTMEDELDFEVENFNRQVVTENFNRVVCDVLAAQIDPSMPGKTLIFCATDLHADMVVKLLSAAFEAKYGAVDADAVKKITGASDKPLELIRRFRNEKLPAVAVTVDLLTTGIDVPSICNLVFLRRVRSRILYEQMLGRATRLWSDGEFTKEAFHIFDAVDLYKDLEPYTSMKPVVVDPKFTFAQLAEELSRLTDEAARQTVAEQLVAKLQRKKRAFLGEKNSQLFEAAAGGGVEEIVKQLAQATPTELATWLSQHALLVPLLDKVTGGGLPLLISEHADELLSVTQGFGPGRKKPEDYLEGFGRFLKENENKVEALKLVMQRPRDLTRAELKKLKLELDQAGYSEAELRAAYRATTNADIAASIMGFIRQRALGEPLKSYELRVEEALLRVLASRPWTDPQRKWLKRIAKAIRENEVVDRPLFDEAAYQTEGGFSRIDKVFDGKLAEVVAQLQDQVWKAG
ncbi:MAG: type I restriction-modification system endonuclease [Myxococcaceae bacterium]